MAQFSVNPRRFDPYKNFKFRVKWDGRYVAGVSKVGGLKKTTEVVKPPRGLTLSESTILGLFFIQRYRFLTIKPGAYPWRNHANAWRPAHIHFSLFGRSFLSRLVTQMYFPGDPLMAHDPMVQSVRDGRARERMVSRFELGLTRPEWALGYAFDIILRGENATPFEERT